MSSAARLDQTSPEDARLLLERCCGASSWVAAMLSRRPFLSDAALFALADELWLAATPADVQEALEHHPRIGTDLDELRRRFASTSSWAVGEQAGAAIADEATLLRLRDGNVAYEARFGHIFVVCATGKTALELLTILESRLHNAPDDELKIAASEQSQITRLRLEKLA